MIRSSSWVANACCIVSPSQRVIRQRVIRQRVIHLFSLHVGTEPYQKALDVRYTVARQAPHIALKTYVLPPDVSLNMDSANEHGY